MQGVKDAGFEAIAAVPGFSKLLAAKVLGGLGVEVPVAPVESTVVPTPGLAPDDAIVRAADVTDIDDPRPEPSIEQPGDAPSPLQTFTE